MPNIDWVDLIGTLLATGLGAWLAYRLAIKQEQRRDAQLYGALRASLLTEIEYNGNQANIYLSSPYRAPAYRLQRVAFDAAFPQLISSETLRPSQVRALIEFYSQVNQVNWCMDEVHRYRLERDENGMQGEISRLRKKLEEMNAPASRFYTPAIEALGGVHS